MEAWTLNNSDNSVDFLWLNYWQYSKRSRQHGHGGVCMAEAAVSTGTENQLPAGAPALLATRLLCCSMIVRPIVHRGHACSTYSQHSCRRQAALLGSHWLSALPPYKLRLCADVCMAGS